MNKKSVFFVATKYKKQPVHVQFYTKKGEQVDFSAVKKQKTQEGVHFYIEAKGAKK